MSRVAVHRKLPPLEKVLGQFSGFPPGKSHQQTMTEELRGAAKRLRTGKPRAFYSMRETGAFFGVPIGTVFQAYQALERDGIINRIRGSRTILAGKTVLPRDVVRGVVGLPVWLHSMTLLPYTRTLVMEMEERLRHSGYVADIIFHVSKEEEADPEFALRLLRHRLDTVVLHTPLAGARQNILSLREHGVRVIVIQREMARQDLPAVIYVQDYQPAYQELALKWRQAGIRKVWLWSAPEDLAYKAEINSFKKILGQHGLETEAVNDTPGQLLKKIRQLKPKQLSGVAFIDSTHSEQICNCEPHVIEQIARSARLGFCVGRIRVPYLQYRKVPVDIVESSPTELARRLVDDICRLSVLPDKNVNTLFAQYQEQILL